MSTPDRVDLIVYHTEDGQAAVQLQTLDGSVWLNQGEMAELFDTTKKNVSLHTKNILKERELPKASVVKEYLTTAEDGKRYRTKHYNLHMILAVGYRVRSRRGTQFRQWATARLGEYLVKGFTLDDERLKGNTGAVDYFDELLARIRDIRASEARVYQRIRDILALASDYQPDEQPTQRFFATAQNKMHYAATGLTAAEIVRQRADANQPNMGLTNWKGGQVIKRDVVTAKNYLNAQEIDTLNRITVMFLDQAEFRAMRRQDIKMGDWEAFLDKFLGDTELPVLAGAGRISHSRAQNWAEQQYDAFAERRRLVAEQQAEARYLEDLRGSAKALETERKPSAQKQVRGKKCNAEKKMGDK